MDKGSPAVVDLRASLPAWYAWLDPFMLGPILQKAGMAWSIRPEQVFSAWQHWQQDALRWQGNSWHSLVEPGSPDPFPAKEDDLRFNDEVWSNNPFWDSVKEWYLFNTRWLQDTLYVTPELNERERNLAAFWLRQWLNAIAPTNFLGLNPVALDKALETRGESLLAGTKNFLRDLSEGDIAMTDRDAFQVGKNLATTPGAVVYRGRLLEVIHYQAVTDKVHAVPMVIVSPWINKFYILDLDEKKSLVNYLVHQGFSVFITSWKNPGPEDSELSFDDYVVDGIDRIVEVAREISGSPTVNITGYCIGGTLTSVWLAWLARRNEESKVASATLLTTLTDFERPGDIEVFIDEDGLDFIDRKMEKQGYLDGKDMAASFRMLRSNSLIWNYWVGNYLMGETPRAFDILYWNMDTTRMPRKMHSYYLREFYQHNRLKDPDALTIAGEKIDLGLISVPLFMVSTEEDHIAPWKQTWKLVPRVSSDLTYTLSSSGHIIGIVNPPSPTSRRQYRQGKPEAGQSADDWLATRESHSGSWWPSWVEWLKPVSGAEKAFKLSSRKHPKLCDAPGSYVLE